MDVQFIEDKPIVEVHLTLLSSEYLRAGPLIVPDAAR